MKRAIPVALAGLIAASGLIGELAVRAQSQGRVEGQPYVHALSGSTRTIDIMLSWGDGQAFEAIARDPGLAHADAFTQGASELAYRAQRPLLSYLAWAVALGRPEWVGWGLVGVIVLSAGLAAGLGAVLAERAGASRWLGLGALLMPGALASLNGLESEPLGLALAIGGVLAWVASPPRRTAAAVLFVASVLARETMIVVPGALAVHGVLSRPRRLDALALPSAAAAVWAAWVALVSLRTGASPFDAGAGRLGGPVRGLAVAAGGWGIDDLVVALLCLALVIAALPRLRRDASAWIAAAHLPLAVLFGAQVWGTWENFSRPLLPMQAFALFAVAPRAVKRLGPALTHAATAPQDGTTGGAPAPPPREAP